MTAIEVDRIETWPRRVQTYVEESLPTLKRWARRQREIDQLCERDIPARLDPPPNVHQDFADEFVDHLDELLTPHTFTVRHCTRICETDISHIEQVGMVPLSPERTAERIEAIRSAGLIDSTQAAMLIASSVSADPYRRGRTSWILGCAPLKDIAGVYRLLQSWGGEAMYWAHERDDLAPVLRQIGTAAIVEAEVPYNMIDSIWTMGCRFRSALAASESVSFEATTQELVPAAMVQRIVLHGTDAFELLTGASTWGIDLTGAGS